MMKSLIKSLAALATLAWVGNVSAASLGSVTPTDSIPFANVVSGQFSDTWDFTLLADASVSLSATTQSITGFGGELAGPSGTQSLTLNSVSIPPATISLLSFTGNLLAGNYTLTFSGDAGTKGSYGGSFDVKPVPVPAALWLLGSALVGMVGIGRRTATA